MGEQGLWIHDTGGLPRRPKSKKDVKEVAAMAPGAIEFEWTSLFLSPAEKAALPRTFADIPEGFKLLMFVTPCPYTDRRSFGSVVRTAKGLVIK